MIFAEDVKVASNEFNNNKMDATFGNESDEFYNHDETSESVWSSDTSQQSHGSSKKLFLNNQNLKPIMLPLFHYCFSFN